MGIQETSCLSVCQQLIQTFSSETYFCAQLFSQKFLAYYYPCTQMAELAHTYGFIHKFYVHVVPG